MLKLILLISSSIILTKPHIMLWALSISTFIMIKFNFLSILHTSFLYMNILLDSLSAPLILLSTLTTFMMLLASFSIYLNNKNTNMFSNLCLSLLLILMFSFFTPNFITFYIMFEAALIPTLFIILSWGYQPERLQAGLYLMMYTVTASLPLLMMLTYTFKFTNTLFMMPLYPMNLQLSTTMSLMFTAAFLVKMPMYITHLWLPKAHVEAPVAGSMILAGVLLKLGAYGLIRLMTSYPLILSPLYYLLFSISLWGVVSTSFICIRQHDMKSLIAYSSVGHMALAIMGILSSMKWGWEGSLMIMFAHGLASSGMFALANMTYEMTNTRSLFLMKGMLFISPTMALWWFLLSIANMGAPPSLNLVSEIFLLTAISSMNLISTLFVGLGMFLAAVYSLILYSSLHHNSPSQFSHPTPISHHRNNMISIGHTTPVFLLFVSLIFFSSLIM